MQAPACSGACWRSPGAQTPFHQENEARPSLALGELLTSSASQRKAPGGTRRQEREGGCGDAGRRRACRQRAPQSCRELLRKGGKQVGRGAPSTEAAPFGTVTLQGTNGQCWTKFSTRRQGEAQTTASWCTHPGPGALLLRVTSPGALHTLATLSSAKSLPWAVSTSSSFGSLNPSGSSEPSPGKHCLHPLSTCHRWPPLV